MIQILSDQAFYKLCWAYLSYWKRFDLHGTFTHHVRTFQKYHVDRHPFEHCETPGSRSEGLFYCGLNFYPANPIEVCHPYCLLAITTKLCLSACFASSAVPMHYLCSSSFRVTFEICYDILKKKNSEPILFSSDHDLLCIAVLKFACHA